MREISISRPQGMTCHKTVLWVDVNGKKLARLMSGQKILMQVDEGAQVIRIHGGFWEGKAFQDTFKIPAGPYSYSLRADFIRVTLSRYVPVLCPFSGQPHEMPQFITLMGAKLTKCLMEEEVRAKVRCSHDAHFTLILQPDEWRLQLNHAQSSQCLVRSGYPHSGDDIAEMIMKAAGSCSPSTEVGRAHILDGVMQHFIAALPDYEQQGECSIVFKG